MMKKAEPAPELYPIALTHSTISPVFPQQTAVTANHRVYKQQEQRRRLLLLFTAVNIARKSIASSTIAGGLDMDPLAERDSRVRGVYWVLIT
jgi:hypothetical protein